MRLGDFWKVWQPPYLSRSVRKEREGGQRKKIKNIDNSLRGEKKDKRDFFRARHTFIIHATCVVFTRQGEAIFTHDDTWVESRERNRDRPAAWPSFPLRSGSISSTELLLVGVRVRVRVRKTAIDDITFCRLLERHSSEMEIERGPTSCTGETKSLKVRGPLSSYSAACAKFKTIWWIWP